MTGLSARREEGFLGVAREFAPVQRGRVWMDYDELLAPPGHRVGMNAPATNRKPGQAGLSALTFGKRDLPDVVAYVENQKERHREGRLEESLERLGDE